MAIDTAISIGPLLSNGSVTRGRVRGISPDGYVLVSFGRSDVSHRCEVLCTLEQQKAPRVGATVLVLEADDSSHLTPVVLGTIGTLGTMAEPILGTIAPPRPNHAIPGELVLEAKQSLTLRVGDGSITIRADGKILIKGKDLVSHAQRVNRIKGGAVTIN